MKTLMMYLAILFIAAAPFAHAQPYAYLCRYPLNNTADDVEGRYGPMTLHNIEFQPLGGIYSSGVYGNSNAVTAMTPELSRVIFKGFSLSVQFKVDSLSGGMLPIIIGGYDYRWLGFGINADSTMYLKYNNSNYQYSTLKCALGMWHQATLGYDSASGTAELYLDGWFACSVAFTLVHGGDGDRNFGISDMAAGISFKGYMVDLQIMVDSASIASAADPMAPRSLALAQNYPNPVHGSTAIDFTLPAAASATLRIYNALGQCVGTPLNDFLPAGAHSVQWNADHLPPGLYTYRLTAGGSTQVRTMLVQHR